MNKFMLSCPEGDRIMLIVIFDPQGREEEAMSFPAHSLLIDGKGEPIRPIEKRIMNGWLNAAYYLMPGQLERVARANTVGLIVQGSYEAPVFLGFDAIPFAEGAPKLAGIMNGCKAVIAKPRER